MKNAFAKSRFEGFVVEIKRGRTIRLAGRRLLGYEGVLMKSAKNSLPSITDAVNSLCMVNRATVCNMVADYRLYCGAHDGFEKKVPYGMLRDLFIELVGVELPEDEKVGRDSVLRHLYIDRNVIPVYGEFDHTFARGDSVAGCKVVGFGPKVIRLERRGRVGNVDLYQFALDCFHWGSTTVNGVLQPIGKVVGQETTSA